MLLLFVENDEKIEVLPNVLLRKSDVKMVTEDRNCGSGR